MIITRTPYRISLIGGGTDYPDWSKIHGGEVISTTIDKFVYISCRKLPEFFDHKFRLVYSKIEVCNNISELEHPTAREILNYFSIDEGLEIHYDGDLPARSGMGSSSAFSVGLIRALYAYRRENVSPEALAKEAIHIEQDIVGETVGSQDQVSAAYGGLNRIEFRQDGEIIVQPLNISSERKKQLNNKLMLFFSGISRTAEEIAITYVSDIKSKKKQLEAIREFTKEAYEVIERGSSLDRFGELLHDSWVMKRGLSSAVSNSSIDLMYETARSAGALGGKLTGAGGGGMLLLYVPESKQDNVRDALSDLLYVPFTFSTKGSELLLNDGSNGNRDQQ